MSATLNFPPIAPTLTSGWQGFPLGDGGYVIGINVSATGAAGGAYCKTDVAGGYYWNGTSWHQVCNVTSLGGPTPAIAGGVWELVGAPSNYQKAYMVYGDPARQDQSGHFAVWASSNAGQTSWTKTGLAFSSNGSIYWAHVGNDLPNAIHGKFSNQKIVVDPANANVAYVGIPFGVSMEGTYSASTPSVFRTLDGGTTWAAVAGLPAAANYAGYAGMCIDKSSGTTTLSGQTVTNRILLPCAGVGVYESTNGGSSFTKISADATPSTAVSYTTTIANSIIIVQVQCYANNHVVGVTNTGTATLTWTKRAGPTRNDITAVNLFEYYAVAASAGTYSISVNYIDGCIAYLTNTTNAASCTAGVISGTAFTAGGTVTGTFAIGQELTGTGIPTSDASAGLGYGRGNGVYIVSGSAPNWVINTPLTVASTTIAGRTRVANMVNVFAVKGCDVTSMPGSAFDAGGPVLGASPFDGSISITTAAANCLVFAFGYSGYGIPGSTTPDAGFTLMGSSANPPFWSEISTAPMAAGTRTPGSAITPVMLIGDALKQGAAMTIALNGTPQYATSGPSPGAQPVVVQTGQMDNLGTYWCVNGLSTRVNGNIWRRKSGVWECVTGSSASAINAGMFFGTPSAGGWGFAICVDPRSGFEGRVTFTGPNGGYRGFQTQNGNAALASMTWTGITEGSGGTHISNISAPVVPWLAEGATSSSGSAIGDMVQDPVTGKYWQASGHGIHALNADMHLDYTGFICNGTNESQGIEEILVQQVLAVPGASYPLVGCEDETILISNLPLFPTTRALPSSIDAHAWGMDYASNNPAFVWAYIYGQISGKASRWSNNSGAAGSWRAPTAMPPAPALGGCVACATTGADGLSATNATANVVIIPGKGVVTPIYTLDNGNTWLNTDLPTQAYIGTMEWCTTLLAADRVTIGTYYCYAPNNGVYRSTNFGASWTKVSGVVSSDAGSTLCGYTVLSVPGQRDHLWIVSNWYGPASQGLNYSTDGGANWAVVSGVTPAANPNGSPIWLAIGKAAPGNLYPTLFVYAKIGGVDGYYRGVCNGAGPSAGFTWTKFGDLTSTPSSNNVGTTMSQIWGDPNIYGRLYVGWPANGVFLFNP